jgi:SAM-dependent methyltransferase
VIEAGLRRRYAKLCDLSDFDETLRNRIRDIVPGLDPDAEIHRKYWEYALLTFFLEDVGLGEEAEVLSVGAGHEEVLYWLANRTAKVVATDIYGEGEFRSREAEATMLTDPDAFAPYPYRRDRLHVQKMDARELEFRDDSFDLVFTLSSIEHFGSSTDVSRAASEIGRVVRPGGHAFIVTECFISSGLLDSRMLQTAARMLSLGRLARNASPRRRVIDVFTAQEIERSIVRPSGLDLVQEFDTTVSQETLENVIPMRGDRVEAAPDRQYPHIVLRAEAALGPLPIRTGTWTSAALPLAKPAA